MPKIRILLCQETLGRGGVEKRKLSVARTLDSSKYEIKIICTVANAGITKEFTEAGVEVIPIGKFKHPFHFSQYGRVLKLIKNFKPHIIHGAVFEGVTLACVAGYLGKVPVIIGEETSDPQNRSAKASFLLRIITSLADTVVAIAPAVGQYLECVAKIPKHKIRVINNGVEMPELISKEKLEEFKVRYGIRQGELVVGSVGRLQDDHKRFSDVIRAVALLPNRTNIKILIVGGGNDAAMLKDIASKEGLSEQLLLVGYQHDTAPFYQLMDIFCLASKREGFGLVAAEAMLHGLPVVASKVGGLKDVVEDQQTGYLVPALQPEIIAEKLQLLINNPQLRTDMGHAGLQRAREQFTAKAYVEKVEKMYLELLAKKDIKI